ncbi:MAG: UDP-N-acetylglucosamine 1-carboxyvinyltransferase [Pseudomonadota bacterium]
MDKLVIEGGLSLRGEVCISGAKNAALPVLCSAILSSGTSTFKNVPVLRVVATMGRLLRRLGCSVVAEDGSATLVVSANGLNQLEAPYELVKTMRASVLVLGPLLARHGRARVSLPGGCAIGARPIDQHLKGLEAMGVEISLVHGYVEASARRLTGARIVCDMPTVTGTENLMMAAALAKGVTLIENAAREPEVTELARVLNKMGARIQDAGTSTIAIEGVDSLAAVEHEIVPDRIEAGTYMIAAAATGGDLLVRRCVPEHLEAVIAKLCSAGASVTAEEDGLRVRGPSHRLQSVHITTAPYPGFPTDMQAQFMVLAAIADGQSIFVETVFENRYMHVPELTRMGADIHVEGRTCIVRGVPKLMGATVMASDLRASAALVIAGLAAIGHTEVLRVYHLDRGYQRMEERLAPLGARASRVHVEGEL